MMDTVTKRLFITGRVQGVGFRYFTIQEAGRLEVTGWVKNRRDGRVEAVVQGSPGRLEKMVDRLKEGPSASGVGDMEIIDLPDSEEFTRFEVRK